MKSLTTILAGAVLLSATSAAALAHHSFAMFDQTTKVEFTGYVSEVQWTNPHVWIMVDVPQDDGTAVSWGVEFTSKVHLTRRGFSPDLFSIGDEVTFSVSPYADGSPGGRYFWVQLADGTYVCDVGAAQRTCQERN
ncbi:MAG: hypothetical protein ACI934_000783 [Pseudohongiellaceae bacterium]|jgi:hypothetical protein